MEQIYSNDLEHQVPKTPSEDFNKEDNGSSTPATSPDSTFDRKAEGSVSDDECKMNDQENWGHENAGVENIALVDHPDDKEGECEEFETERLEQHQTEDKRRKEETEIAPATSSKASKVSSAIPSRQTAMSNQQALMIESGKLLEHLRKEIYKLRSQNSQLRSDFESLQGNNQRLMDANSSLGSTFDTVNKHAKQVSKDNSKLKQELQKTKEKMYAERNEYKAQIQALKMAQAESKEELKMKQGTYIAEVHSRLHYQKVLANIVDKIQERCRDHRLVEEILAMSDECAL